MDFGIERLSETFPSANHNSVKFASLPVVASILVFALAPVAGCSSNPASVPGDGVPDAAPPQETPDSAPRVDSAAPPPDGGGSNPDTGVQSGGDGGSCSAHCTSDTDCENNCAIPPAGSVDCCDTQTNECFVTSGMCPVPVSDAGSMAPPY
jgi:hypothetical protein